MSGNTKANNNPGWENFFTELQSNGRYSFTIEELRQKMDLSEDALQQGLYRYKAKKQVVQIRKGFYSIVPPEYSKQGMLPPYLFIDDLMKSLNKPYYVALISAAAIHGAAHQQPMYYFVIAQTPAPRNINSKKLKILFFSKSTWNQEDIIKKSTNAGYINVSSPELTAMDLLTYTDKIGLNKTVTILKELSQSIKGTSLTKAAKNYASIAVIQRLGYLFDKVLKEEKLALALQKAIKGKNIFPIPLSLKKAKQGDTDEIWKVIKNMEIESDL